MIQFRWFSKATVAVAFGVVLASADVVVAQGRSLLEDPRVGAFASTQARTPMVAAQVPSTPQSGTIIVPSAPVYSDMAQASWTYSPPTPGRVLRIHDVVSIRIDEVARMTAEGRANQRKSGGYQAALKEWLELDGFGVKKAPQTSGDPEVNTILNEQNRATSDLQTRETLALNIAAEIVDIRPNGNIVLEGHKAITINDNRWEVSISGMCQWKDIGPDNVILSKDIIDLKIDKRESGQARDGYRRGWFTTWFNRLQPF